MRERKSSREAKRSEVKELTLKFKKIKEEEEEEKDFLNRQRLEFESGMLTV